MNPKIKLTVTNGPINIGAISLIGVSSSSSLLLGDTQSITLYSFFDTPPESVIVGPMVPLPEPPEEDMA